MQTLMRLRFTLLFLALMVGANWVAGTLSGGLPASVLERWGISHQTVLGGEAHRLLTGMFLSHNPAMFLRQLGFAALVIGHYEWQRGSGRAIAMFFGIDILGSLAVLFLVLPVLTFWPVFGAGNVFTIQDVGMSAGGFGLLGAGLAFYRVRWFLLALVVAGIAMKVGIAFEPIADSAHLICLGLGVALQVQLDARARRKRRAKFAKM